jgi:hypothetical protein
MDLPTLRAAEEELLTSATRHDQDRLRELLHPEFFEIGRWGKRWSRDEIVAALANEATRSPVTTSDWEYSEMAPGVALVSYAVHGAGRDSRHSSVWVSTDEKPQLRFHQGTFIAAQ